jgi:hypothetical protein
MRRLILTATAALAVAACGKNAQTDNANVVSDDLTAESIVSNDVTAIDAVTGDAANMASDVDMNSGDFGNAVGDEPTGESEKPTQHEKTAPARASATENSASALAASSTSNTTANAE